MFSDILQLVNYYVRLCFKISDSSRLSFHNIAHTEDVVMRAEEIGAAYNLNEKDHFTLVCAAWFHDLGYLYASPARHEEKGVELMKDFLQILCETGIISEIEKLILSTKPFSQPATLLEKIICDADTYHFGTPQFQITDQLVRKEFEMSAGSEIKDWNTRSLNLLRSHRFHTSYCMKLLNEGKLANIKLLESQVQ